MSELTEVNWEKILKGTPAKIRCRNRWQDYWKSIKILKDCGDIYIIHDPQIKSVYSVKKSEVRIDEVKNVEEQYRR